jgi:hypothetical protein
VGDAHITELYGCATEAGVTVAVFVPLERCVPSHTLEGAQAVVASRIAVDISYNMRKYYYKYRFLNKQ